jgi:hypothetical protein
MEYSGDLGNLLRLVYQGLDNFGVAVALAAGSYSAHKVHVSLASDIPDMDSLSSLHNDRVRKVVVAQVGSVHLKVVLGRFRCNLNVC